jgi:2-iminobutanoate/2-iminopropanoate deaminase
MTELRPTSQLAGGRMEKRQVNPWTWQDQFGFSQAWRVDEGQIVGEDDFDAQARQTFENLQTVLDRSGATFESVIKMTVYLTDMTNLPDYGRIKSEFVKGKQPASTAIEVKSLAFPAMMIEVEAIAVL